MGYMGETDVRVALWREQNSAHGVLQPANETSAIPAASPVKILLACRTRHSRHNAFAASPFTRMQSLALFITAGRCRTSISQCHIPLARHKSNYNHRVALSCTHQTDTTRTCAMLAAMASSTGVGKQIRRTTCRQRTLPQARLHTRSG